MDDFSSPPAGLIWVTLWVGLLGGAASIFFLLRFLWNRWLSDWYATRSRTAAPGQAKFLAHEIAHSLVSKRNPAPAQSLSLLLILFGVGVIFVTNIAHETIPLARAMLEELGLAAGDLAPAHVRFAFVAATIGWVSLPLTLGLNALRPLIRPGPRRKRLLRRLYQTLRKTGLRGQEVRLVAQLMIDREIEKLGPDITFPLVPEK